MSEESTGEIKNRISELENQDPLYWACCRLERVLCRAVKEGKDYSYLSGGIERWAKKFDLDEGGVRELGELLRK